MRTSELERYKFTEMLLKQLVWEPLKETPNAPTGSEVRDLARSLLRNGATHKRLAEELCSVEMSEKEAARHEKKDNQCEARVVALCEPYGIKPIFGGDPRGCTIKLALPSGYVDDWGKEGFCVPTS